MEGKNYRAKNEGQEVWKERAKDGNGGRQERRMGIVDGKNDGR